jgi:hypothetical protein
MPDEQTFPADLDQTLGTMLGDRPEAFSDAGR